MQIEMLKMWILTHFDVWYRTGKFCALIAQEFKGRRATTDNHDFCCDYHHSVMKNTYWLEENR